MRLRILGLALAAVGPMGAACSGSGDSDGTGGGGGSGPPSSWGGDGSYEIVAASEEGRPIVDVALNEEHVYWLTGSTQDEVTLTYNHDGALHRRRIEGGETETVLEGLLKPSGIKVTSSEAYLWFARDSRTEDQILFGRVSLDGGAIERVDLPEPFAWRFKSFGERAYLHHELAEGAGVFEYLPGQEPRRVLEITEYDLALPFAVDATHIYYSVLSSTYRLALSGGGSPELLTEFPVAFDFAPGQTQLVALRTVEAGILDVLAMPTTGGSWEKFAEIPLQPLQGHSSPEAAGSRWFATLDFQEDGTFVKRTWTGLVGQGEVELVPDFLPDCEDWAVSEENLFRSNATKLVRIPLE